jgi:hypothetical protein
LTCRHQDPRDHATPMVVKDQHADPPPGDHSARCKGCLPCPRHHCTVCNIHLLPGEQQTCTDCLAQTRRDLNAIVDNAALLPDHALDAAHDGHLVASDPIPGGDALVMMSRGSEGLSDTGDTAAADEPLPPSYVLAWWEEQLREHLALASRAPAWRRRPAATLVGAHRFLNEQLTWAAANHPGFHALATDLRRLRAHLDELLRAGDAPAQGVPCFTCGTHLEREYRRPRPCKCGPRPRPPHTAHHRVDLCCLGCVIELRWWITHHTHDQGGLKVDDPYADWHCPRCNVSYRPGQYQRAVKDTYIKNAGTLPVTELAERTGIPAGTIRRWASGRTTTHKGEVIKIPPQLRPRGRTPDGRKTYLVEDVLRLRGVSLDSGAADA